MRVGFLPVIVVGVFICLYLFELLSQGRIIHTIITGSTITLSTTALNTTRGFDLELQVLHQEENEGLRQEENITVAVGSGFRVPFIAHKNETATELENKGESDPSSEGKLQAAGMGFIKSEVFLNETNLLGTFRVPTSPQNETGALQIETKMLRSKQNETDIKHQHLLSNNKPSLITLPPLNDQSIPWDTTIHRPWLDPSVPDPPAMIVLTNFAWNHPNQTFGLEQYRGYRTKELLEGIVNHPYFYPTGWEDLNSGRMQISNTTRYYVFLDSETCGEKNYPRYGHGFVVNRDESHGLGGNQRKTFAEEIVASTLYREAPLFKFVIFNCGGFGTPKYFRRRRRLFHPADRCALLHLSSEYQQAKPWDQGLPPPVCRRCVLTSQEEADISMCNEDNRPILISFAGQVSRSATRQRLYQLHNGNDIIVANYKNLQDRVYNRVNTTDLGEAFERLAKASAFSAASRGDNLFSYRFSEVMSCGSIPVVYANDWMLPFGNSLINWTAIVVVINEEDTNRTSEILSRISKEERCRRRQKVVEIYRKYIESGRGVMSGIIENFELAAAQAENFHPPKAGYMQLPI